MPAEVVSLAAARQRRALAHRDRSRLQAEIQGGLVVLLARNQDVAFTPAALRSTLRHLEALADSAATGEPVQHLSEDELFTRLARLALAVERFDNGAAQVSDLLAAVRLVTKGVRLVPGGDR